MLCQNRITPIFWATQNILVVSFGSSVSLSLTGSLRVDSFEMLSNGIAGIAKIEVEVDTSAAESME